MINKIPLDNQFVCRYPAPLDDRFIADSLAELITRDTTNFYENMTVFVKDDKTFYYLADGSVGDNVNDWIDLFSLNDGSTIFLPYESTQSYIVGETCRINSNMFICISPAAIDEDPINYPAKWLQLKATEYLAYDFTNVSNVTLAHQILNPIIEVYWSKSVTEFLPITPYINAINSNSIYVEFSESISGRIVLK